MTVTKTTRRQSVLKNRNKNKKSKKAVKHCTTLQAARIYVHDQDFNALVLILQLCSLVKDQS